MSKENVVDTYKGILFSPEKEGSSVTYDNRDESRRHSAEWNKPQKDKNYKIPLI